MITYGIGVLPLIRKLNDAPPRVTQPLYADDAGAGAGVFEHILEKSQDLQARGTPRDYFPDPTKIILFVSMRNVARAEQFFCRIEVKIVTGSC